MNKQSKEETELATKVMLHGWPVLKSMLINAYAYGYENGHYDTVEGAFWGNGRAEVHFDYAEEWVNDNLEIFKEGV